MSAPRITTLAVLLAALLAQGPATAGAVTSAPCPASPVGRCLTLTVPLDRSGAIPGQIRLRAARVRARRASRPPLIALTGGPGQAGVVFAGTYALILPAERRDLVVLDQRGTGASGLLRCPAFERRALTSFASPAGACGRSLGARRPFYTSADSAEDLEALRIRIGAPRIALYAVSYGTRVALEYARRHPERVERIVLDSPIGPGAPDPLARETLAAIPRVVRSACRDGGCGRAGAHPVGDLARLRIRLRRAPIRGVGADDLVAMLVTADLEPELMREIPQAVRSALAGRGRPLATLRRALLGAGGLSLVSEFSPALFATTTCEESPLAWDPAATPATRRSQARAAADATPATTLYPFDRRAALAAGQLALCVDWPAPARAVAPAPAPQPTIPALILSGELDLRTPLEKARALTQSLPGARLLVERGVGHSVLGASPGGCAASAVAAFLDRRAPSPCPRRGASVTITPARSITPSGRRESAAWSGPDMSVR